MIRSDEHWLELADSFSAAALGSTGWDTPLSGFAAACGAHAGQLVGFGADTAIPFNLITGIDPGMGHEFIEVNGGDPNVNPRVRAGLASPVLKVLADADYVIGDEMSRSTPYTDLCRKYDIPFICQTNLVKEDQLLIGLAVLRTARQGHITAEDRAAFASMTAHVRSAARTQIALESRGAELLAGTLEALSFAAFVCDRLGRIRAMTPMAERLASAGNGIQVRQGHFHAALPTDDLTLNKAIHMAANRTGPRTTQLLQTVVVRSKTAQISSPLVLDVISLSAQAHEFTFSACVLIIARGKKSTATRNAFILQTAYGLTAAEAEVALLLATGQTVEAIAMHRAVSDSTIRSQFKSIFSKLGVSRQIEIAVLLSELL